MPIEVDMGNFGETSPDFNSGLKLLENLPEQGSVQPSRNLPQNFHGSDVGNGQNPQGLSDFTNREGSSEHQNGRSDFLDFTKCSGAQVSQQSLGSAVEYTNFVPEK